MAKKKQTLPEMRCFLACEAVSQEPGSSKKSLHSIFDTIWTEKTPGAFRPFFLFAKLVGNSGKRKLTLKGTGPDKKPFGEPTEINVDFGKKGVADITIQLGTTPLAKFGVLAFEFSIDGKRLGWPCEIRIRDVTERGGKDADHKK